jgi:ATP-binding cassette subfamily B protein
MQPVTKQTISQYWDHTKKYKLGFSVLAIAVLSTSVINVAQPIIFKDLIDTLSAPGPNHKDRIWDIVKLLLLVEFARQIVWRTMGYVVNFCQPRVMSDLLMTCYKYLLGHSYGFFTNNFVGSIVTRTRRFHGSYERVTDVIIFELSHTLFGIVLVLGVMYTVNVNLGLIATVWVIGFMSFVYAVARYKIKFDLALAEQDTKVTGHLADTLTNSINLKLFSSTQAEIERFKELTDDLFRKRKRSWDIGNHANVVQGFAMVAVEIGVLYLSVQYWMAGTITVGEVVMLNSFMSQIFHNLWDFGRSIKNLYEGFADANEMTQMLTEPHEVVDEYDCKDLVVTRGDIEFRDVDFHYNEASPIFGKFNLKIRSGEWVGIVGPSGAGKSTVIKLLFRFKNIQSGQILVDEQDISKVSQVSLRKSISLVPQDVSLLHRSLLDNIRYGKPEATEEEVVAAAKAAHAHEFISKFPEGYHTLVGERGVKLSGGERQRVAIAMAILENAPILVLDEATSSLDYESEALIRDALETLMKGKTTIVIAHRLSTIRKMDRTVVMDEGVVVQDGSHIELLASSGIYQRLWQIQANGLEMAPQ